MVEAAPDCIPVKVKLSESLILALLPRFDSWEGLEIFGSGETSRERYT